MKFTNDSDSIKNFLQSQVLAANVSQDGQQEMMKQLTAINESSVSLHDAAKRGDLQKMQEFIADGKDVNAKDFKGVTALGYAVGHDQLSTVKVLIDAKANINDVDSAGNSAVHFAAGYGRVKVLEHLLARGANASKVNQMGQTPMAVAQQNKQQQAVALLQRHGAK